MMAIYVQPMAWTRQRCQGSAPRWAALLFLLINSARVASGDSISTLLNRQGLAPSLLPAEPPLARTGMERDGTAGSAARLQL